MPRQYASCPTFVPTAGFAHDERRRVRGFGREVDTVGWIALLVGTGIIAWSGILVRFLDVGPLAGAAWRMGLAAPALAVWARLAGALLRPEISRFFWPLLFSGIGSRNRFINL